MASDDPRPRVLALLHRHGWNATSFQVLEDGFRYWFAGPEACVAYVDTGSAWVAAGAPVAPESELAEVTARFVEAARARRRRACFFGAETRLTDASGLRRLCVGEQPVWDPTGWEATLRGSRSLREQLRRARAKGVSVRALAADEVLANAPARRAIEDLIVRWLAAREMAPMGFLVDVQPFEFPEERRYLVAEREGRVVGFLAAVPVYARGGWFFEDLLRDGAAPNGTAELLIDAGMRRAAAEGSRYVTLGLAPLAGSVGAELRAIRDRAAGLYDFRGLHAFKSRLKPDRWDPIYLAHPPRVAAPVALYDTLRAFARGSFARFGVETALRGPPLVVHALAAALVPWTAALALAPGRWFPGPWAQAAWVAFDVALAAALFALGMRWRHALAVALAAVITADAALTAAQALLYNLARVRGPSDALILVVACLAPASAAAVLWGALARRARLDAPARPRP